MTGGEIVDLKLKDVLHEPDDDARYVYFPLSGVISLLTVLEDGSAVEIATVGSEGMADFAAYLGMESPARWLVQVPGKALRIDAKKSPAAGRRLAAFSQRHAQLHAGDVHPGLADGSL